MIQRISGNTIKISKSQIFSELGLQHVNTIVLYAKTNLECLHLHAIRDSVPSDVKINNECQGATR